MRGGEWRAPSRSAILYARSGTPASRVVQNMPAEARAWLFTVFIVRSCGRCAPCLFWRKRESRQCWLDGVSVLPSRPRTGGRWGGSAEFEVAGCQLAVRSRIPEPVRRVGQRPGRFAEQSQLYSLVVDGSSLVGVVRGNSVAGVGGSLMGRFAERTQLP